MGELIELSSRARRPDYKTRETTPQERSIERARKAGKLATENMSQQLIEGDAQTYRFLPHWFRQRPPMGLIKGEIEPGELVGEQSEAEVVPLWDDVQDS